MYCIQRTGIGAVAAFMYVSSIKDTLMIRELKAHLLDAAAIVPIPCYRPLLVSSPAYSNLVLNDRQLCQWPIDAVAWHVG